MEKKFEFGLVLGRFQCFHKGHKEMIDLASKLCQKTLVLIGSAQESGSFRNPFRWETRKQLIQSVYPENTVLVEGLDDLTNENDISFEWGKYILDNIVKRYGKKPDLMVYGKDDSRKGWFSEEDSRTFSEMIVARDKMKISATEVRELLAKDCKEEWKKYVPEQIWDKYESLRNELLRVEEYKKISKNPR